MTTCKVPLLAEQDDCTCAVTGSSSSPHAPSLSGKFLSFRYDKLTERRVADLLVCVVPATVQMYGAPSEMLVLAFKSQTLTRGESMGTCSFICADEVDKVFLECAFNHVPGVHRLRDPVTTEGSERQKKGKKFGNLI